MQLRGCHTSSRQPHHCHNHLLISDKATMSGMRCAKYNSGDCTGTGVQWRLLAIVAAEDTDGAGAVSHHRLPPIVSCIGRGRTQPPPPPSCTGLLKTKAASPGVCSLHHGSTTTLQQPAAVIQTIPTPSPSLHLPGTVIGHSLLFSHCTEEFSN